MERQTKPISDRRAERELFFWTAQQGLKLLVLAALSAYSIVSLIEGHLPGLELVLRQFS
jgi:hypothetical protein